MRIPLNKIVQAVSSLAVTAVLLGIASAAHAVNTVQLRCMRPVILADGKQSTDIMAIVRDSAGRQIANNTQVQFSTTAGTLSQQQVYTDFSGTARVRLTSSSIPGIAKVSAFTAGGTPDSIEIEFTDDPAATYAGNNYMLFTAKTYLAYAASERVIEGEGLNGGAHLAFRNFDITADRMQFRCDDGILRANGNISVKRGPHKLQAERLYYSLVSNEGWAVTKETGTTPKTVRLYGENMRQEESKLPPPYSYMAMPALNVKLIISAVSITYFPNDKLQFKKPRFFQDQAQIMAMNYYEIPLHSDQLFTDQFFSVGTSGFGLELPYYYNLTPTGAGVATLRHQQAIGRGYVNYNPGWAVDVIQSYNSNNDHKFEGAYGFTGLTRSDWDFRWNHNMELDSHTQTSFDFETPSHNSIFGSTNISQQFNILRWGANISGGQTFLADHTQSTRADVYLETQPRSLLGLKSMLYTVGTTFLSAHSQSANVALVPTGSETREGLNFHAFSRPIPVDKHTQFTSSFTVGNTWAGHEGSGVTSQATLALDHSFNKAGNLNFSYDLMVQPGSFYDSQGKHRLSTSYNFSQSKNFSLSVFGSAYVDTSDRSLLADMTYKLDKNWRLMGAATLQKYNDLSYTDFEVMIGRRLGAREMQLAYSTYLKRISVDYTATRF
jgi:Bacterial Ig-like domain (group 1)